MAKYTERLAIKMMPEDMAILAEMSLRARVPLTTYARELLIKQINPMLKNGGGHARATMEDIKPHPVEN